MLWFFYIKFFLFNYFHIYNIKNFYYLVLIFSLLKNNNNRIFTFEKIKINEKERLEKERLEKERLEKERLEKERLEKERLEKERIEKI